MRRGTLGAAARELPDLGRSGAWAPALTCSGGGLGGEGGRGLLDSCRDRQARARTCTSGQ